MGEDHQQVQHALIQLKAGEHTVIQLLVHLELHDGPSALFPQCYIDINVRRVKTAETCVGLCVSPLRVPQLKDNVGFCEIMPVKLHFIVEPWAFHDTLFFVKKLLQSTAVYQLPFLCGGINHKTMR